ncbi:hypothetical protein [Dyadobacter sp. 3J3]|uniref:hypothetical protein n=1 Tax=Dyadobacter sp. 3J3 TaxID=2606600 RepID=UPI00135924F5|nr:hypothetical protein [Dyadobacter sp. 3J3]
MAGKKKDVVENQGFIVKDEFRDRTDFNKIHYVGSDVSHLEKSVLESLVSRGLVEPPLKTEIKAKADSDKEQADSGDNQGEESSGSEANSGSGQAEDKSQTADEGAKTNEAE